MIRPKTIIEHAEQYLRENNLRGRTPVHSANRFVRLMGSLSPAEISDDEILEYRRRCIEAELAAKTIEGSVNDICMLVEDATGKRPETGKRLRQEMPEFSAPTLHQIGSVYSVAHMATCPIPRYWPHAAPAADWWRAFIVVGSWTGLRVSDVLNLKWDNIHEDRIRYRSSKVRKPHEFPMTPWLRRHLDALNTHNEFVFGGCFRSSKHTVLDQLHAFSDACGVERLINKSFRRFAISAWTKANATAGDMIHGIGIGVRRNYLVMFDVLSSVADRVMMPDQFLSPEEQAEKQEGTDELLRNWDRLDSSARDAIAEMMRRMS